MEVIAKLKLGRPVTSRLTTGGRFSQIVDLFIGICTGLTPSGSGAEPQPKLYLVHFSFKI